MSSDLPTSMPNILAVISAHNSDPDALQVINHASNADLVHDAHRPCACLVLPLTPAPLTSAGFVFGRSSSSDVRMPGVRGLGRRHFSLGLDRLGRLFVRALDDHRVSVGYSGDFRKRTSTDGTWIVAGADMFVKKRLEVVVYARGGRGEKVAFRIVPSDAVSRLAVPSRVLRAFRLGQQGTTPPPTPSLTLVASSSFSSPSSSSPSATAKHRWIIRRKIGEGSFGVVWHTYNVRTGVELAMKSVKVPSRQPTDVAQFKASARREAEILETLRHPHVVYYRGLILIPVRRPSWLGRSSHLLFEYLPLGDLASFLSHHRSDGASASDVLAVLLQLLSALEYIHARDVTHGDVKPTNVLVAHADPLVVKLSDFGTARRGPSAGYPACTLYYLAPEVVRGETYGCAIDVWALGVTATELLTARGLPTHRYESVGLQGWADAMVRFCVDSVPSESGLRRSLFQVILLDILVDNQRRRSTARECLQALAPLR